MDPAIGTAIQARTINSSDALKQTKNDKPVRPDLGKRDLEGIQRHDHEVFDRSVLALAQEGRAALSTCTASIWPFSKAM